MVTQAQKYQQETGDSMNGSFTIPEAEEKLKRFVSWLENKADNQDAHILGLQAALAQADKERDMYKDMAISFARLTEIFSTTEECTKIAHKWLSKEREKERGNEHHKYNGLHSSQEETNEH